MWFTGLSGAGKSTLANYLDQKLYQSGIHSFLLDGDELRHGLCRDLGMSMKDRSENNRRAGEVASLMVDAGLVVLSAFISPSRLDREAVREMFGPGRFIEVYVNTPLEECERRDPKGIYKRARLGEISNFTGIDSPYEAPERAEFVINTTASSPGQTLSAVLKLCLKRIEVTS